MKYLSVILIGCLLACSQVRTPEKPARADKFDCQNVYTYIVTLQVNDLQPRNNNERDAIEWSVEQEYEGTGARERFLRSCEATMTKAQVECALKVNDVANMHTCTTLVR